MRTASENTEKAFTSLSIVSRAELTMSFAFVVSGFLRCRPVLDSPEWNASGTLGELL